MADHVTMQGLGMVVVEVVVTCRLRARPVQPGHNRGQLYHCDIKLDGWLDEPAWKEAQVLTLGQQSPWPSKENPYHTEVRVLIPGQNQLRLGEGRQLRSAALAETVRLRLGQSKFPSPLTNKCLSLER